MITQWTAKSNSFKFDCWITFFRSYSFLFFIKGS